MKYCPRCGEQKPLTEFNRAKRRDGFQTYCRSCHNRMNLDSYYQSRDRKRAESAARLEEEWAAVAAHAQRFGIKTEGYSDEERRRIVALYRDWFGTPNEPAPAVSI